MSTLLTKFIKEIWVPLTFTSTEKALLRKLRFLGGTYSEFAEIIDSHPEAKFKLVKDTNDAFKGKLKESVESAHHALSLLGFVTARNYLAVSNFLRVSIKPNDPGIPKLLKFALEAESMGGESGPHFFVAGLVYDMLKLTFTSQMDAKDQVPYSQFLDQLWKHGASLSKIVRSLGKSLFPEKNLQRDLGIDCLLHDIGKVPFYLYSKEIGYPGDQLNAPHLADQQWTIEQTFSKSNKLSHTTFGYIMLSELGFLRDTSWVALYHHQPFLAENLTGKIHARTLLVWLGDHLLRYKEFHRTSNISDRLIQNWHKVCEPFVVKCTRDQFKATIATALA